MTLMCVPLMVGCTEPQSGEPAVAATADASGASDSWTPEDTGRVSNPPIALDFEERFLLSEPLGDCLRATLVDDYLHICHRADGAWLADERDDSQQWLGAVEESAASRTASGDIVLALDGETHSYDSGELTPLPMPIPVPIVELYTHGDTVWLLGSGRLFRWWEDAVTEVSFAEYPTIYGAVATGDSLFLAVPWLVEVRWVDDVPQVQSVGDRAVSSMAADTDGNLWFVSDDRLFIQRPGKTPIPLELPEPVHDVMGPNIWVAGLETSYRYDGGRFSAHPIAPDGWVGVDGYGRILQVDGESLVRHSIDRPVVVTGLSDSLMVQETALLLPSDPGSVTHLRAWLNAEPLVVSTEPWTVQLNPDDLENGVHQLRFFCESDLGDTQAEHPVWVGELPDVEWSEIEALSNAHCIGCHGGATLTNLSTKADWERLIDAIIHQVTIQSMPQNGPYLSEQQITMIRGWKDGGFQ